VGRGRRSALSCAIRRLARPAAPAAWRDRRIQPRTHGSPIV
jgi:hypothetical protein